MVNDSYFRFDNDDDMIFHRFHTIMRTDDKAMVQCAKKVLAIMDHIFAHDCGAMRYIMFNRENLTAFKSKYSST